MDRAVRDPSRAASPRESKPGKRSSRPVPAAPPRGQRIQHSLVEGLRLGRYQIVGALGRGGMGAVYVAEDTDLRRNVALKLLPRHLTTDPGSLRRFRREARAAAALNHPNIVTIYGIERVRRRLLIAMELVEGVCLDASIPAGGLPVERVVPLAVQMLEALAVAHDAGIVHRDLKGTNVMISTSGRIKILDFGLAKRTPLREIEATGAPTASLATDGLPVGTVPYMAPEQLLGGTVDHRADLFAFGILLYWMIAGRHPFGGTSWAGMVTSILRDEPAPLGTLRRGVPQALERVVAKCLAKDPDKRFPRARDALDALAEPSGSREPADRAAPPASGRSSAVDEVIGIAVLPFRCLSPDPRDRFLADGLMEEITNVLTRTGRVRVVSRTTCLGLDGTVEPAPCLARKLRVRYLLEGSVRRAGTAVRITAQLVDAPRDAHVWSDTTTREADDIFVVEDVIADRVARALTSIRHHPEKRPGPGGDGRHLPTRPGVSRENSPSDWRRQAAG